MIEPQKYRTSQNKKLASRIICDYPTLNVVLLAMLLVLSLLCISCGVFDPYEQCDESLELGDTFTFTVTELYKVDEDEGDCSKAVPLEVGTVMHVSVDDFVGGEKCESASGAVEIEGGPELEWLGVGGSAKHQAAFRGSYDFHLEDCQYNCHLEFLESSVRYDCYSGCEFASCAGTYFGTRVAE